MVGADPKFIAIDRWDRAQHPALRRRARSFRWHWLAMAAIFVPLSLVLVQCGKAPNAGAIAANAEGAKSNVAKNNVATFDDRFPQPQGERHATAPRSRGGSPAGAISYQEFRNCSDHPPQCPKIHRQPV